jgi:hypothetical protein
MFLVGFFPVVERKLSTTENLVSNYKKIRKYKLDYVKHAFS